MDLKGMDEWMGPVSSGLGQGRVADLHDRDSEYWLYIKLGELSS
jgi:hypothetical protein